MNRQLGVSDTFSCLDLLVRLYVSLVDGCYFQLTPWLFPTMGIRLIKIPGYSIRPGSTATLAGFVGTAIEAFTASLFVSHPVKYRGLLPYFIKIVVQNIANR